MPRTPIDVYRGIAQTRIGDDIKGSILRFVKPFAGHLFAEESISLYLVRFIGVISRLIAYLDTRYVVGREDLTIAIDLLDQVTSTTKWWVLERKDPGLILRPRVRDPREFMLSTRTISLNGATQSRISGAVDKLGRFLEEQDLGDERERNELADSLGLCWTLLGGFICRSEGRQVTSEEDFERAYDFMRILLFYTTLTDYRALVASRSLASNQVLIKAAKIVLSPGFERSIASSVAAQLEEKHARFLTQVMPSKPSASRNILTNSLRLLAQIQGVEKDVQRVNEMEYESFTLTSIQQLEGMGISSTSLGDEASVIKLFKNLKPEEALNNRLDLLTRRLEGFTMDASGNRDFLLQYARFMPRLLSLLLLVAAGTKTTPDELTDHDIKRGLILLNEFLNEQIRS